MNQTFSTYQLKALFRAIIASKFTNQPSDSDLLTSTHLATAARSIGKIIQEEDIKQWGNIATKNWEVWYWLTPERDEWKQAITNGSNLFRQNWHKWPKEKQAELIDALICPFDIQDELKIEFFSELSEQLNNATDQNKN